MRQVKLKVRQRLISSSVGNGEEPRHHIFPRRKQSSGSQLAGRVAIFVIFRVELK